MSINRQSYRHSPEGLDPLIMAYMASPNDDMLNIPGKHLVQKGEEEEGEEGKKEEEEDEEEEKETNILTKM